MNCRKVAGVLVAVSICSVAAMAQAELITNGSFTDGLMGWSQVDTVYPDTLSPDGHNASIHTSSELYQNNGTAHPFAAEETYTISFTAAQVAFSIADGVQMKAALIDVTDSNATVAYQDYTATFNTWDSHTIHYTVEDARIGHEWQIAFFNLVPSTDCWAGIDNVSVTAAIPEPSCLVLLVIGLFGLMAYAWRRRK